MRNGQPTRDKLMIEAFKLFASRPYDRVTYADLGEATGLSRGAILYHVKTKERLFLNVVKRFVFEQTSVSRISSKFHSNLYQFLVHFIKACEKEKKEMIDLGISNINNAMLNIEISAFFAIPRMRDFAYEWYIKEKETWRIVIENAILKNEIRNDIDVDIFIDLFENVYLGASIEGILYHDGYKIDRLKKEFMQLYELIKS